jgi:formylglycine-generating enzyme required for sulfatase activity
METNSNERKSDLNSAPLLGMAFAPIPGGSFYMGSPESQVGRDIDEGPTHLVTIKPFMMMTTQVTQSMWQLVMGPDDLIRCGFHGDSLPVEIITWFQCQEFIRKLNTLDPEKGYRLPSEAEWEYACRAATTTSFYFGDDEDGLSSGAWYSCNSEGKTHAVGKKKPNAWGLYDMHGNVSEWCQDQYHDDYSGAPTDGLAWEIGGKPYRVLRGGSYKDTAKFCRSALRNASPPSGGGLSIGFRLVRNL